jgi:type IV pilus assembly protein PilM
MSILSGVGDFFGLDIGAGAIRAVQLRGGKVKSLDHYGFQEVDTKLTQSDAPSDQQKLAQIIRQAVIDAGVTTTNVAVGVPSNRVFSAVVDFDRLPADELAKTIRYQADSLIPTPLAESKLDWALLGDSPKDPNKVEVLISSVSNDFIEKRLDILESIGLNVIAFEPDSLALSRALLAPDTTAATMIVDMGDLATDIVMVMNGTPRLIRAIPTGTESVLKAAMQNLSIDGKQAQQFVFKFGLSQDKLEGQIHHAIIGTVDVLVSEIEKSIKFFQTRYGNTAVDRIIVTGGASILPEFPLYLANKFGLNVEIGNAWRNIAFSADRQNELMAVSNHFGVAAGLAGRVE